MLAAAILLALLFMLGFVSTVQYVDRKRVRVRAWWSASSKNVNVTQESESESEPEQELPAAPAETGDEMRKIFAAFDKDGDGYITREELRAAMEGAGVAVGEREVAEMVEKMDGNGDGVIDLREFCASMGAGEEEEERALREAFDVFDGNGDGAISVEELGKVLVSMGLRQGLRVQDCEEMIRKVDADGDGRIDFGEFKKMMRAGGSLFGSSSASSSS
uniref:EF-hand domain-containing protein n=1 Tax=Kalanchoe fedtschenkoi TaxID=63787 RepID=A0A7N0TBG9_KALFE